MWGPVSFHSKVEKVKKVVRLDKHSRVQTYLNTHRRKVVPSWNLLDMKLVDRTSVSAVLWQSKQQWVSGWTDMWTKLPRSHGRCFSSSWRKGIKKKKTPNHVRCRAQTGPELPPLLFPMGPIPPVPDCEVCTRSCSHCCYFAAVQIDYRVVVNRHQLSGEIRT